LSKTIRLHVMKEQLAIAHESNDLKKAGEILRRIRTLDRIGEEYPDEDTWLPGVIFWREAHLLQISNPRKSVDALCIADKAVKWYESINASNPSGLGSALLNAGWLQYVNKREDSIEYFARAAHLSRGVSPRTFLHATIGEYISRLRFYRKESVHLVPALVHSLGEARRVRDTKNYVLLGAEKNPEVILLNLIKSDPRLFLESLLGTYQSLGKDFANLSLTFPSLEGGTIDGKTRP
jgi:hypothetical protein